jgi:periplasmic divalent cation tolerance protein
MSKIAIIKTTCKTKDEAKNIARILLDQKLAACAQISIIESLYCQNGKIIEEKEFLLSLKVKSSLYKNIEKLIITNHSYKTPQIIKIPVEDGFMNYLNWILNS